MSRSKCKGYDELLLEAWERCVDDPGLRSSAAYGCVRTWLGRLTSDGRRGQDEEGRLRRLVFALRAAADGEMSLEDLLQTDNCPITVKADVCEYRRSDDECDDDCMPKVVKAAAAQPKCNRKLVAALEAGECIRDMRLFFRDVAAYTCDGGAVLMRVTEAMLAEYRAFTDSMFSNRVLQIGMVLAREQEVFRNAFAALECRTINRAQMALLHMQNVLPKFDWNRYVEEKGYMAMLVAAIGEDPSLCAVPGETESDDAREKRLMYQLNWLRSEVERAECVNKGLSAQHADMNAELATVNQAIVDSQCLMTSRRERLACDLKGLREESSRQVQLMDELMESVQMSIHSAQANSRERDVIA